MADSALLAHFSKYHSPTTTLAPHPTNGVRSVDNPHGNVRVEKSVATNSVGSYKAKGGADVYSGSGGSTVIITPEVYSGSGGAYRGRGGAMAVTKPGGVEAIQMATPKIYAGKGGSTKIDELRMKLKSLR
jgi:hypothetical protein